MIFIKIIDNNLEFTQSIEIFSSFNFLHVKNLVSRELKK